MRNAQPHDVQETGLSERSLLDEESRHETRATPVARQRILLPGVSLKQDKDDQSVLNVAGASLRQCDTCFLRDRGCPGYAPGHSCLYELPIEAKSAAQIKGIEAGLIAMQTQRVMFMRMTEDLEGGYPDPNLSSEIDRLTRMIKAQREGSMDKFSLHISGSQQASGEAGAISRIFGQEAAAAQSIGPPKVVDDMIRESMMGEVFEGEVVDG